MATISANDTSARLVLVPRGGSAVAKWPRLEYARSRAVTIQSIEAACARWLSSGGVRDEDAVTWALASTPSIGMPSRNPHERSVPTFVGVAAGSSVSITSTLTVIGGHALPSTSVTLRWE